MHTFLSPLSLHSWPLPPCPVEPSCRSAGTGHVECSATVCGDNGHSVTRAYTGAADGVSVEWQWCVASTEICRISKCKNSYKLTGLWKGHVVASMINATNSRAVMKELVQTGDCMLVMVRFELWKELLISLSLSMCCELSALNLCLLSAAISSTTNLFVKAWCTELEPGPAFHYQHYRHMECLHPQFQVQESQNDRMVWVGGTLKIF